MPSKLFLKWLEAVALVALCGTASDRIESLPQHSVCYNNNGLIKYNKAIFS
jgi:hypothetical protein